MNLNIEIPDDIGAALRARARAEGVTADSYASRMIENTIAPGLRAARETTEPKSLVRFFRESPLVGLELRFERDRDPGRDVDF